ncbi:hypothetical protein DUNSADRAFT_12933, partial [Dunaliella salina]
RKRIEAREALRKAEEAYMEQRRQELLSDKDGYWHQRMRMEEQAAAQSSTINEAVDDAALGFESTAPSAATHHHHASNRSQLHPDVKGGGRKGSQQHSEDANGGGHGGEGRRGRGREGRGNAAAEANGGPPSGSRFHRECSL